VKKNSLLNAIRGSEGRYEIAPTLKLLFSAEQVVALSRLYAQRADSPESREEGA